MTVIRTALMAVLAVLLVSSAGVAQNVNQWEQWMDAVDGPEVGPTRPMSPPYARTRAKISVHCYPGAEWAVWITFSNGMDLTGGSVVDGWHWFDLAAEIDGSSVKWRAARQLSPTPGDTLSLGEVQGAETILYALMQSSELVITFPWRNEGHVTFRWPLDGAHEAIAKIVQDRDGNGCWYPSWRRP